MFCEWQTMPHDVPTLSACRRPGKVFKVPNFVQDPDKLKIIVSGGSLHAETLRNSIRMVGVYDS